MWLQPSATCVQLGRSVATVLTVTETTAALLVLQAKLNQAPGPCVPPVPLGNSPMQGRHSAPIVLLARRTRMETQQQAVRCAAVVRPQVLVRHYASTVPLEGATRTIRRQTVMPATAACMPQLVHMAPMTRAPAAFLAQLDSTITISLRTLLPAVNRARLARSSATLGS